MSQAVAIRRAWYGAETQLFVATAERAGRRFAFGLLLRSGQRGGAEPGADAIHRRDKPKAVQGVGVRERATQEVGGGAVAGFADIEGGGGWKIVNLDRKRRVVD